MIEFILARYNYWIVIILMMTGLYIVFSRGNLVKTIIGLNLFQTSVFIFYITIGKVSGGTAPILIDSGDHAADAGHAAQGHDAIGAVVEGHHDADLLGVDHSVLATDLADPLSQEAAEAYVSGQSANTLDTNLAGDASHAALGATQNLHSLPSDMPSANSLAAPMNDSAEGVISSAHGDMTDSADQPSNAITIAPSGDSAGDGTANINHAAEAGHHAAPSHGSDGAEVLLETVYSNPLPHVLILTAIVVGVATTAVGLAIAVRIREAFGTIEEDALEQMNNEAEFGMTDTEQQAGGVT